MRTIKVVTSQHRPYYDTIGKFCIDSFLENWDSSIPLEIYAEEFIPDQKVDRLIVNSMEPVLNRWQKYINLRGTTKKTKMAKFWLKSFVVIDAIKNSNEDILIWLDSDVITHAKITPEILYNLLPEDTLLCDIPALGKLTNKESETGFCMLNLRHPMLKKFLKEYENYYKTKEGLSTLPRDIDSSVWWAARNTVVEKGAKVNGLHSTINSHVPFMGTCLKEYMRHWVTKSNKSVFAKGTASVTFEEQGVTGHYDTKTGAVSVSPIE
jgi:hypothetical protein